MNDILVIGSANVDMVVKSEKFPEVGETLIGGSFNKFLGGKGANQAVAAVRLKGDVKFICKIGADEFGTSSIQQYKKEGLNTDFILIDENHSTGVALISVNKTGENKIVVAPGANNEFNVSDVDSFKQVIAAAKIVVLQLEIPVTTVGKIIEVAKKYNTDVILNPAPAQNLPENFLKNLFLITPNEMEAQQLTGIRVNEEDEMQRAANLLHKKGVENVVITLGEKGAFISSEAYTDLVPSPNVKVQDTTAAGDVFNGALAVALTNKKKWESAIKYACSAAALSVTKNGAQDSAPSEKQLKEFMRGL